MPLGSEVIDRLLRVRRIAVVGLSQDPDKPSHEIATYLLSVGKEVVPVNPNHTSILGQACYPSLTSIQSPVDLVVVFRRPEHCPQVVQEAIEARIPAVWLQLGIVSTEAQRLAESAQLDFVQNRCFMVEHSARNTK